MRADEHARASDSATSTMRFSTLLKPRSGTSLMLMIGRPSRSSSRARKRDELQQVGHDVDVDALAAGELDHAEHLDVLFDRQRDVDLVHLLAQRRLGARSPVVPSSGRPR